MRLTKISRLVQIFLQPVGVSSPRFANELTKERFRVFSDIDRFQDLKHLPSVLHICSEGSANVCTLVIATRRFSLFDNKFSNKFSLFFTAWFSMQQLDVCYPGGCINLWKQEFLSVMQMRAGVNNTCRTVWCDSLCLVWCNASNYVFAIVKNV